MPAGDDLLIAGTKPESLLQFEAAPHVTTIDRADGIVAGAGQKLGHAFFKLEDTNPNSRAVIRTVVGLGTTVRINKAHLTPILSSPKELTNGAPRLSKNWLLTLGERLPNSDAVREYIRFGIAQEVHNAPSVRARGGSWWEISPKLWNIAVPMNAQFKHQIAWLDQPGAVTNNFNALSIGEPSHAAIVAASLASAFGALSRLYISGEVGCEGARRVLLAQFETWPILDPVSIRDQRAIERCLSAYERWKEFEGSELDVMPQTELDAWRDLSTAVARAALGNSATAVQATALAESAIREAQATVARRRAREAAALSGRTRQSGGSRNSLAARVRQWVAQSSDFVRVVELMTSGPRVFSIRAPGDLENFALFSDEHPYGAIPEIERAFATLLGGGFDAAWPDTGSLPQVEETLRLVKLIAADAKTAVLGPPPPDSSAARVTWDQLATDLEGVLRRTLQSAVRGALA